MKDFLKKDLIGGLQNVVQGVEGLIPLASNVQAVLPISDYYQGLFAQANNIIDGLSEVAEATGNKIVKFRPWVIFYELSKPISHRAYIIRKN